MNLYSSRNKNGLVRFLEDAILQCNFSGQVSEAKYAWKETLAVKHLSKFSHNFMLAHFYLKGYLEKDKYLNLLKNVGT